jgi:cyclic pyranopterin phosphate synthase
MEFGRGIIRNDCFSQQLDKDMQHKQTELIDSHSRHIKKLRLNLLDACNMRCMYCMPKNQTFKSISNLLTPAEMKKIVANLLKFGVNEVRLTGGEPLLHPQFQEIVKGLSGLDLKKLGLTTNGILLDKQLPFLKEYGVNSINVSLDSLEAKSFAFITNNDVFDRVFASVLKAKELGFNVKLNTVMLKNINFEEIENFLDFSAKHDIEVRFLEMMKIGYARQHFDRHFVSADQAIERIALSWDLHQKKMPADSTSFNFIAHKKEKVAQVGFIASETKPFCDGCSRLRLSNEGVLRPCIMINEGPSIRDLDVEGYEFVLRDLIEKKPTYRLEGNLKQMNEIGG